MNANQKIQQAMRRNEVELIAHMRKHGVVYYSPLLGNSWQKALDRLEAAKQVRYSKNMMGYILRKGSRPITPAVR